MVTDFVKKISRVIWIYAKLTLCTEQIKSFRLTGKKEGNICFLQCISTCTRNCKQEIPKLIQ